MKKKLIATCAVVGALALTGVATALAGASTKHTSAAKTRHSTQSTAPGPMGGGGPGGPGGPGGGFGGPHGAVHSVSAVLNKDGTAYITETSDHGTVVSVDASASTITLKEGTKTVTYATPTLTIPSTATVMLDGKSSSLGALAAGDDVTVTSSSDGTRVFATDSSFKPEWGGQHGGPPPPSPTSSSAEAGSAA